MMHTIPATAAMLVKNLERCLSEVLSVLKDSGEILLLNNGPTDHTFEIAKSFPNVSYCKHEFIGFGPMKNLATRLTQSGWILSIDSDEVADKALIEAIHAAVLENEEEHVFSLSCLNHYHGRLIKDCSWYPDVIPRLYHRGFTRFFDRQVHESLVLPQEAKVKQLDGRLKHYSFGNTEGLIQEMQQYGSLYTGENHFRKDSSPFKALLHGGVSFVKNYLLERGLAYGVDRLAISVSNAQGSYYRYVKLYERNRTITTSLIIATYNRPDILELVLRSALSQTRLPDEIIVADDSSKQETAGVVDFIRRRASIPIKHSWQPDGDFRAAESHNRTLAQAKGDYIVLTNGGMVLDPSFIADHLKIARKGRLIQGSRVTLTEDKAQGILDEGDLSTLSMFSSGMEKWLSTLRYHCLAKLTDRRGNRKHKGIKTCNMDFFRSDALVVNGSDNNFVGWGRGNSGFVARCHHNGMKHHNLKFTDIAYHLWHSEAGRDSLPQNDALLEVTLSERKIYCVRGVSDFIKDEGVVGK